MAVTKIVLHEKNEEVSLSKRYTEQVTFFFIFGVEGEVCDIHNIVESTSYDED